MTEKLQIYKCEICGNIAQILIPGSGALVCCGEEMKLLNIQHDETELGEKHTPKFENNDSGRNVNVIGHPMTEEHYIQFIQAYSQDKNEIYTKYFYPEEEPKTNISFMPENSKAVEYCNIHRLWGSKDN